MGVYIKRYGDYVMIGSQVPQEGYEWYDGEIPQLIDYELQYHKWENGKVVVGYKYSLEQLKEKAQELNLQKYKEFCKENDYEIIKYQKRTELKINTQKDLNDYQIAMQEYKNKTIEYKNKKEQIEKATKEEDLINIIEELKINNFLKF